MKEQGIEPVMNLALERGSTDATAQSLRIKTANADFVLGCLYEAELAILLRDLHKYGVSVPVIGALGADFESTHKRVNNPAAVKNFYLPYQFKAPMGSPDMKKWEDMFVKYLEKSELPENGIPTNFYYFGLPTAIATVEAFKRAGPQPSREKFIAAMETLKDFDTGVLADKVTITRDNHVGVQNMYAVGLNEQGKQTVFIGLGEAAVVSGSRRADARAIAVLPQLVVSGLAQGVLYALVALSMTMVYRATTVVNFGHGDLVMGGAFVVYVLVVYARLPYLVGGLLALADPVRPGHGDPPGAHAAHHVRPPPRASP